MKEVGGARALEARKACQKGPRSREIDREGMRSSITKQIICTLVLCGWMPHPLIYLELDVDVHFPCNQPRRECQREIACGEMQYRSACNPRTRAGFCALHVARCLLLEYFYFTDPLSLRAAACISRKNTCMLQVSERVLGAVYGALSEANVFLEGTLLKPQMIMAGVDAPEKKVC